MPFPNTKAMIKHSIYMLVFLTHTTILNETQVPKVSDSTMIVELDLIPSGLVGNPCAN